MDKVGQKYSIASMQRKIEVWRGVARGKVPDSIIMLDQLLQTYKASVEYGNKMWADGLEDRAYADDAAGLLRIRLEQDHLYHASRVDEIKARLKGGE